jgi:hypothetical protein
LTNKRTLTERIASISIDTVTHWSVTDHLAFGI